MAFVPILWRLNCIVSVHLAPVVLVMLLVKRVYSLLFDDYLILMLVVGSGGALIWYRLRISERVQISLPSLASLEWSLSRTIDIHVGILGTFEILFNGLMVSVLMDSLISTVRHTLLS